MGELVPLKRIYFRGRDVRYADVPRNTLDLRWRACPDHHLACDCREAETAEHITELLGELAWFRRIFDEELKGHATDGPNEFDQCRCTGCVIARRTGLRSWLDVQEERRDALGVPTTPGGMSVACEYENHKLCRGCSCGCHQPWSGEVPF